MKNRAAISSPKTPAPQPGRSCPLHYRYSPADFARPADFTAETLYVIGGLYGNVPALEAVLELAASEPTQVTLVFNGDFNWFNVDDAAFRAINSVVLRHHALRGNVETELADDHSDAGCGCAYPDDVGAEDVARSNAIIAQLHTTAKRHAHLRALLGALPMHRVAAVGDLRVAMVHGDLNSLAGWSLSQTTLATQEEKNNVIKQILASECRLVASSHTCLPVALTLDTPLGCGAIFNNGAAGMPNFRGTSFGLLTRIATTPAPSVSHSAIYGTRIGNVHVDALAVPYDQARWQREFTANWPVGSAGHEAYFQRIMRGPAYGVADANRLAANHSPVARPAASA